MFIIESENSNAVLLQPSIYYRKFNFYLNDDKKYTNINNYKPLMFNTLAQAKEFLSIINEIDFVKNEYYKIKYCSIQKLKITKLRSKKEICNLQLAYSELIEIRIYPYKEKFYLTLNK